MCVCVQEVERDLLRFGERLVAEIDALGRQCELKPPVLQHYDAWGRRVDRILTCDAWTRLKRISAQEGLVAAGYERTYGEWRSESTFKSVQLLISQHRLHTCVCVCVLFLCPGGDLNLNMHRHTGTRVTVGT